MPQYATNPDFLQRLATLEESVEQLRRRGRERDELPFFGTNLQVMPYQSYTSMTTVCETVLSPRTASLSLGLVTIGDVVTSVNSGGDWQVVANADIVMTGVISATFSYEFAAAVIDLTPYRALTELKILIQARRTAGATTGGKFGTGGAIAIAPRYARLI
ncbi:hypothetical protein [Streptomyces scopuliridis]|uniref:Uncharacterized protein n=1 Tax=Streptomyces scopuliridis RB72 TaxID=1440053 RepID=A0A2T7SP27_9ACTN|nr:hypothetical protein [Streptomyces scopuliridis]PVE04658.1 hypothetical protein Y717_10710 [Streptomyces scopuliridis RB72]